MEAEAELGDNHLGSSISHRRRSASVSDDYSVQKTNDDATEAKFSAIKAGYWEDRFLKNFIVNPDNIHRRAPEILRGYWARHAAFTLLLKKALQVTGPNTQIINLGAGFDTLYFRLLDEGINFSKLVEVDFSSVTAKKIRLIGKSPELVSFFNGSIVQESQHSDLHAEKYHLLGADMRQLKEFWSKLELAELDYSMPTIFLSECVLIYMDQSRCDQLLTSLAQKFTNCIMLNYEPVNMSDKFSSIMQSSLHERGIHLPGLPTCYSLETQKERFNAAGFPHAEAWTMQNLYASHFSKEDIQRIESLEMLDERELLSQLLEHYCMVIAVKSATGELNAILDFNAGIQRSNARTHDGALNPPGFNPSYALSTQHSDHAPQNQQQQQHLMSKRAWDMALQPTKSLPMNMFMMYMAGNTISIFPIMMVVMMAWRPIKAIMSVNTAFKGLEAEYTGSLLIPKIIFALGNLAAIGLAVYKCHTMGLLPNHASDWLDFVPPAERMQYALTGDTFI